MPKGSGKGQGKGQDKNKGQGYLHAGHRKRMIKRIRFSDPYIIYDHEILEALLYYVRPRVNTNPTAHELLFKFKTLKKVLKADADDLMSVRGVGKESATFLQILGELSDYALEEAFPLAVGRSRYELDCALHARFYKEESGTYNIIFITMGGGVRCIVPISDSIDFMEAGRLAFRMMVGEPSGFVVVHVRARGHHFTDFDEDMIMMNFVMMANLSFVRTINYIVYDHGQLKYNYFNHPEKHEIFLKALQIDLIKEMRKQDQIEEERRAELKKQNFDYYEDTEGGGRFPKIGDVFNVKKDN